MPIIDPRSMDDKTVERLAQLFDKLEKKAREVGGAKRKSHIKKLSNNVLQFPLQVYKIRGTRPRTDLYRDVISKIRGPQVGSGSVVSFEERYDCNIEKRMGEG